MLSNRLRMLLTGLFALFAFMAVNPASYGQGVTTSGISGTVLSKQGQPIAGASVTAIHVPSGTRYTATTRANGQYELGGMRPGGPYTVTITASNFTPEDKTDISLIVGVVANEDFAMGTEVVQMAAVSVQASADPTFSGGTMSNALQFNSSQVMQIESVRRDIQDIQNLDPRVSVMQVGPSDSQYAVSVAGQNPRENLLLIDGVSGSDNFGLNSNGYAGFRSPVPPEWIESFYFDVANYDVTYAGFSGGITNLTLKSGTNDFHGSVYEIYTGTRFRGPDPIVGIFGAHEPMNEHTTGVTVGGPIIKDKLFFFLGYDAFRELAAPAVQNFIPDNAGGQIDQIIAHTESAYGFNPGTLSATNHVWEQNFVGKIDWNISDAHKFEFTFRHTAGEAPVFYNYTGSFETSLSSSWYNTYRTDQSYTAKINSDWSQIVPNLRTEIEATYVRYNGTAQLNGADFPAIQIAGVTGSSLTGGTPPYELFLGQYWAYQDNNIYTWEQEEHAYGEYSLGAHTLKFGLQLDRTGYTDTFIPNILGSYSFDTVAEYLAGTPTFVQQESPYPGYTLGSDVSHYYLMNVAPLIQDTWRPNEALTLSAGLRMDYPYEPQRPIFSPLFFNSYGYRNNTTGNGNYVLQPRVGFNYQLPTERKTQIRGGAGLIAGTFPVVWYENSFNNAGQLNTISTGSTSTSTSTAVIPNYIFTGAHPTSLIGVVPPSSAVPSFDVIDPKFQMPSNWKENIAIDHELPFWHMVLTLDADFSQVNKDVKLTQLNYQTGAGAGLTYTNASGVVTPVPLKMPDGATRYAGNITTGLSSSSPGETYGTQYTTSTLPTYLFNSVTSISSSTLSANKSTGPVYLLGNTNKGGSQVYSIALNRNLTDGWGWGIGYAHTHATQVDPSPSSVASSGYVDLYNVNPNDNVAYRSQYATPDKVVLRLTHQFNFFKVKNSKTTVAAQFVAQTGQAYSWVFKGDANGSGITGGSLMYVPNGPSDPKVTWASAQDSTNFFNFLAQNSDLQKYEGKIAPRNAFYAPWQKTLNLHVEQQIPVWDNTRLVVFADCYNFANLLNKNWGVTANYNNSFESRTAIGAGYDPSGNGGQGQYVYAFNNNTQTGNTVFNGRTYPGTIYSDMSRYNIQVGARLEF